MASSALQTSNPFVLSCLFLMHVLQVHCAFLAFLHPHSFMTSAFLCAGACFGMFPLFCIATPCWLPIFVFTCWVAAAPTLSDGCRGTGTRGGDAVRQRRRVRWSTMRGEIGRPNEPITLLAPFPRQRDWSAERTLAC